MIADELQKLLGEKNFIKLVENFGGTRLYIAHPDSRDAQIRNVLGYDAAEHLFVYFGNATINVPLARNQRIKFYRNQGLTVKKIARKLGITEKGVGTALKRIKQNST